MRGTTRVPLGIDVSKTSIDVAILKGEKRTKSAKFANTPKGFEQLEQWLSNQGIEEDVHACLEATNIYGVALATHLYEHNHSVSIVNPLRIKGYATSQLSRTKNDAADAGLIARFCRDLKPGLWQPTPDVIAQLQKLSRRIDALTRMKTQEKNRRGLADEELKADIDAHIEFLEGRIESLKKRVRQHIKAHEGLAQQEKLLVSITGIAEQTAAAILAEIGSIEHFSSARQLAAFAGLTPQEFQSGSSIKGKTRLCKIGNARLRKALYFPALVAKRHCPQMNAFYLRLLEAGKTKMQAVGAVMHKLIRVVFGVLKSQQPFDPLKLAPASSICSAENTAPILKLAS